MTNVTNFVLKALGIFYFSFALCSCSLMQTGYQKKDYASFSRVDYHKKPIHFINITSKSADKSNGHYQQKFLSSYQMKRMNNKIEKKLYHLGSGDELKVVVWNHPELNNPTNTASIDVPNKITINNNGEIHYPYVGWIHLSGMDLKKAQIKLSAKLKKYIKNPQVSVHVIKYNSKFAHIMGDVVNPIKIAIGMKNISITDALAEAGGTGPDGNRNIVVLQRSGHKYMIDLKHTTHMFYAGNLILKNKDVVKILNKNDLCSYVIGEANQQKKVCFDQSRISLSNAILSSGGINLKRAHNKYIYVLRSERGKYYAYYIDLRSPESMLLANLFLLYPDDVVFISTHPMARYSDFFSRFSAFSNAAVSSKILLSRQL